MNKLKISTDNMIIKDDVTTYKCPVMGDGTVILPPSKVSKYLGSYIKHKIMNIGILVPARYIVNVISEEVIDNRKWLLINYNNMYYYTPKEYVDCTKVVTINSEVINTSDNSIAKMRLNNPNIIAADSKVANASDTQRETLYTASNCMICEALQNVELKNSPDPNAPTSRTLKKGEKCIVQSIWKNNKYNSKYFGTATFNPNGGVYGKYVNNSNVSLTTPKMLYTVIIEDRVLCNYLNGSNHGSLIRGDRTWPKYQDWGNGYHVNVCQGKDGGLLTYVYPASAAAPLADSSDMFNDQYYGELRVKKTATVYAFHRKSNYKSSSDKKLSLDNISLSAYKDACNSNTTLAGIAEYGFNDPSGGPVGYLTNAETLKTSETMIVVNYTAIKGKNYYIGFKKSNSMNGSVNYIALLDGGDEVIDYEKWPPYGVDRDTTIPRDEGVTLYDPDDTKVDTTTLSGDISNWNDPTHVDNIHGSIDDVDKVEGVHLGVGDTSKFQVPSIMSNAGTVPPDYAGWSITSAVEDYNLSAEKPFDNKHLTHINRFHLPTGNSGLSTKSFIFVTRPDLNLYKETEFSESVDTWSMNPDLKRLATFKYIARMRGTPESPGIGNTIMNSLCYYQTNAINTPWLTVFTNQCNGYSPVDRELDTTEMAETFHGNKVIYAEPTFKHKIGGTVSIPFTERRDLTLYFTLRMWIEYIQAVSMGFCSPRWIHKQNNELDYAVSLFFITTDETMENILYWEKLTGLIPLTVPDSFFEWSEGSGAREMKYNINFAYSFRTIMDEIHLAEINNLYVKYRSSNATGMPIIPQDNYSYVYDQKNNNMIARIAAFYKNDLNADDDTIINSLVNNKDALDKYYYGGVATSESGIYHDYHVVTGSKDGQSTDSIRTKFLPNYNIHTRMYGIPYVKGPFIEHDPSAQKYKLRWV